MGPHAGALLQYPWSVVRSVRCLALFSHVSSPFFFHPKVHLFFSLYGIPVPQLISLILSFFLNIYLLLFTWKSDRQDREWGKERTQTFSLLFHNSNSHNRPKSGARNSIPVLHVSGKMPSIGAVLYCLPAIRIAGTWTGLPEGGTVLLNSNLACWDPCPFPG